MLKSCSLLGGLRQDRVPGLLWRQRPQRLTPATAPHSLHGPAAGQAPGRCRKDEESLQPSAHTGSRFMAQVSRCHSCQLRTCLCRRGSEGSTAQDSGGLGTHGIAHPLGSKGNMPSAHLARRTQPSPQQEGTSRTTGRAGPEPHSQVSTAAPSGWLTVDDGSPACEAHTESPFHPGAMSCPWVQAEGKRPP